MAIRFEDIQGSAVAVPMGSSSGKAMRHARALAPTDVGVRIHAYLRRLYPRDTAKLVSQDTGISVKTICRMLERRSAPSWGHGMLMAFVYGPEFMVAVYPKAPAWLDKAVRAERIARLEADADRIKRELEEMRP